MHVPVTNDDPESCDYVAITKWMLMKALPNQVRVYHKMERPGNLTEQVVGANMIREYHKSATRRLGISQIHLKLVTHGGTSSSQMRSMLKEFLESMATACHTSKGLSDAESMATARHTSILDIRKRILPVYDFTQQWKIPILKTKRQCVSRGRLLKSRSARDSKQKWPRKMTGTS